MIEYHNCPQAMARSLATYITSPTRIKREVDATFDTDFSLRQIGAYQASHLYQKAAAERAGRERIDFAQADRDQRYYRQMHLASNLLAFAVIGQGGHR